MMTFIIIFMGLMVIGVAWFAMHTFLSASYELMRPPPPVYPEEKL